VDVTAYFQEILTGFDQLSFISSLKNMAIRPHPMVQIDGITGMKGLHDVLNVMVNRF
jgi:hypothetical protein